MSTATTNTTPPKPPKPLCYRCSNPADKLLTKTLTATAHAYPVCTTHEPDIEAYGNRTTWPEKHIVRDFNQPPKSAYDVYGRPGASERVWGRVMHVEDPRGDSVLCDHDVSARRRYKLTHTVPDGFYMCRKCTGTSNWAEGYAEDVATRFVWSVRGVLRRNGELPNQATRLVEYRRPAPIDCHRVAEGSDHA